MEKNNFKPLLIILFLGCALSSALAQKLPNVQKASLRAPANIKIDGKATEWKQFEAYNHATEIYYTVANDDSKLYLVVQAPDRPSINKILVGGVTFTVQKSGKKTDKGGVSVTYPIFDKKNTPFVPPVFGLPSGPGIVYHTPPGSYLQVNNKKDFRSDSMMMIYNKNLTYAKYIGVTGIKTLETLISAYNTDGIQTAQRFDNRMCYTYELAIDLNLLGMKTSDESKFAYHIALNGVNPINIPDPRPKQFADSVRTPPGADAVTDLWGEYTLAKK